VKISSLAVRAGVASLPVIAFAPLAGAALTGHGTPWLVLPVGSIAAMVGGARAEKREGSTRRRGVVVDSVPPPAFEPDLNRLRDVVTVEYRWSDAA
jgi:hypothetical protein